MSYSISFLLILVAVSYADYYCPVCLGSACQNNVQLTKCSSLRNMFLGQGCQDLKTFQCIHLKYEDGAETKVLRKCLPSTPHDDICATLLITKPIQLCEVTNASRTIQGLINEDGENDGNLSSSTIGQQSWQLSTSKPSIRTTAPVESETQGGNVSNAMSALPILIISIIFTFLSYN